MVGPPPLSVGPHHADWGYSGPVVALDLLWSLAFAVVSCSMLISTAGERPGVPVRVWVLGYALHYVVHAGLVWFGYRRRKRRRWAMASERRVEAGDGEEGEWGAEESRQSRFLKKLECMNVVASFLWWILGFYWIVVGGQALPRDAPQLYWLMVVFLAFDVFFAIFCIILACIIGFALCWCLPYIIAILYAVVGQEGASNADVNSLPRFRFCNTNQSKSTGMDKEHAVAIRITENCNTTSDLSLSSEDSECCICLSQYEHGVQLHWLPCNHHFHSGCIVKWLRINATCPLCKYNILKGDELV